MIMIIECIKCSKKFQVNSDLIPNEGRTIQCGSCQHIWFYKKINNPKIELEVPQIKDEKDLSIDDIQISDQEKNLQTKKIKKDKNYEIVKFSKKKKSYFFSLTKVLSYILVLIITFFAIIIIIDTFNSFFYRIFPNLEIIMYNFFEILKDINLFLKDLFKQ